MLIILSEAIVLPPLSNNPRTQENLPISVSAILGIICPLLFSDDSFVEQYYRASPDALMCRKIVGLIRELIRLPGAKAANISQKLSDCCFKLEWYEMEKTK